MKSIKKLPTYLLLPVSMLAATAQAQTTVFSESFEGTAGNLNGTTTDVGGFTWTAPTGGSMVLDGSGNLDLSPNGTQYGFVKIADVASVGVYTLTINETVTASTVNGNYAMGAGFTSTATTTMNIREGITLLQNGEERARAYLGASNPFNSATGNATTPSTLTIDLDTTAGIGGIWEITYKYTDKVNGTVTLGATTLDSSTLAGGDGFYVGIGSINGVNGTVQDIELTFIPEPGTYAMLAGLAGFAFVALRRRVES